MALADRVVKGIDNPRRLKRGLVDSIAPPGSWTRAWLDRDIANILVLDSRANLVRLIKTSQSKMEELYPEHRESSCWLPRGTAGVRTAWLFGMPILLAFVVWLAGYMIILGWEGWRWTPTAAAFIQIPISMRLGSAGGYRAMPKPVWLLRVTPEGEIRPLSYSAEWIDGTMTPRHVHTTSQKRDIRDLLSGSTGNWTPGLVPTAGVITGIVVCVVVLALVFVTARGQDDPAAAAEPQPTPIVEDIGSGPLPPFEGTVDLTPQADGQ